jgi:hypothetical protein
MATIDPFLQDAAFDPGALQAMSTAPLVGAFSWNDPGRLRVIRPNQQRVNGTGINAGSSSERPSGHAPGWPFRFASMRKTKWKKLLGGDGVEIVVFTISASVVLGVVYILGFVFRLW